MLKNNVEHKGHARSMNLLLKMIQTRRLPVAASALAYIWRISHRCRRLTCSALDHVSIKHVLDEALSVLRAAHEEEPIVEVLLNDQSSRSCAYAAEEGCPMLGKAGWPRMTRDGIAYRLHDYGTVEPGHAFTYWPGFSLNPGALGRPPTAMRLLRKFW